MSTTTATTAAPSVTTTPVTLSPTLPAPATTATLHLSGTVPLAGYRTFDATTPAAGGSYSGNTTESGITDTLAGPLDLPGGNATIACPEQGTVSVQCLFWISTTAALSDPAPWEPGAPWLGPPRPSWRSMRAAPCSNSTVFPSGRRRRRLRLVPCALRRLGVTYGRSNIASELRDPSAVTPFINREPDAALPFTELQRSGLARKRQMIMVAPRSTG